MMNMIELQEQLKDFSQGQLIQEMKMPSGNVPQYLVLSEMQRRKRMQATAAGDQGMPTTTVAEDAVSAAGVPQGGIAQMARSLAPQTDMTQNTGQGQVPTQRMQAGGIAGVSRDVGDYAPTMGAGMTRDEVRAAQELIDMGMRPDAVMARIADDSDYPDAGNEDRGFGQWLGEGLNASILREYTPDEVAGMSPDERAAYRRALETHGGPEQYLPEGIMDALEAVTSVPRNASQWLLERGGNIASLAGAPGVAGTMLGMAGDFEDLGEQRGQEEEARETRAQAARDAALESFNLAEAAVPFGMTTGDMLSPDEQLLPTAEERAAAGIETPEPEAPETPEEAAGDAGGAGGTGSASAADRLAQQDRWLSLARFGLGLMSSDQPTFGGAIGEAGMNALDYMQGMEQQRFERDLAERTLAARMAGGAGGAGPEGPTFGLSTDTDRFLSRLQMELDRVDAQLAMMGVLPGQTEVEAGSPATVLLSQRQRVLDDIANTMNIGSGGAMSALRAFEQQQQQGGGNSYDVAD